MIYQKRPDIIKHLYCTKQLHDADRKKIASSTGSYWVKKHKVNENVFDHYQQNSSTLDTLIYTLNIAKYTLPKRKNKKSFWQKHINSIVNTLNECKNNYQKQQILKHLNITPQALAKWINLTKCNYSLVNLCAKKHPRQLRENEKNTIKNYMNNPQYKHYNRTQVYWVIRNDKALMINLKTFHKYCDLMNLHHTKQKKFDKRKTKGITAEYYLQKIHLDISYLGLLNNSTAYILNILDNHTRYLLNTKASLICNSHFVAAVLEAIIIKHKLNDIGAEIYTDGGAENFGEVTDMLLKYPNIKHIVCKKDVQHNNNIAEACHKRFKNNVLPHIFFTDITHLQQKLPDYHKIYNQLPQNHLKGMTPNDAVAGIEFDNKTNHQLCLETLKNRIATNRNLVCYKQLE